MCKAAYNFIQICTALYCTAQAAASNNGTITFVFSRGKRTLRLPMSLPAATTAGRARQSVVGFPTSNQAWHDWT